MSEDRQGISTRETCPNDILVELLNKEQGFKSLVEKFDKKYARATISKYLKELVQDGLIAYRENAIEFGKRERPYCLTKLGEEEAKRQGFVNALQGIPNEYMERFIFNYKSVILRKIMVDLSNYLDRNDANKIDPVVEYFISPRIRDQLFQGNTQRDIPRFIDALEKDLRANFDIEEINKIWLMNDRIDIPKLLDVLGSPEFYSVFQCKSQSNYTNYEKEKLLQETKRLLAESRF
jgi:DNA-binding HxlR family transcriptional regulator